MRYLVTFYEDTNCSMNFPPPATFELVEATYNYFADLEKKGKVCEWGFWATGHGGMAVFNVDNHHELQELTELVPIRPMCKVSDAMPIIDNDEFPKAYKKVKTVAMTNWEKWNTAYQAYMPKK